MKLPVPDKDLIFVTLLFIHWYLHFFMHTYIYLICFQIKEKLAFMSLWWSVAVISDQYDSDKILWRKAKQTEAMSGEWRVEWIDPCCPGPVISFRCHLQTMDTFNER